MGSAIRLVENPLDIQPHETAGLAPPRDRGLSGFRDDIFQLQAEVSVLREELARAQRIISQKDVLLRNGMVRELALRMEFAKGAC